jgi:hypothetical protein
MAYDEAKAKTMRGDAEPDPEDPEEESEGEGEGPSEEELAAAKRLGAALEAKNWRAVCAAVKDLA